MMENSFRRFSFREMKGLIEALPYSKIDVPFVSSDLIVALMRSDLMVRQLLGTEPIKIEEPRVIMLTAGKVRVQINLQNYVLQAGDLLAVTQGSIIKVEKISEDTNLMGFGTTPIRLQEIFKGNVPLPFSRPISCVKLAINHDSQTLLHTCFYALWQMVHLKNASSEAINGLLYALLQHVYLLIKHGDGIPSYERSHEQQFFDSFIRLLNEHVKQEHAIGFYADKLCITPRYLSTLINKVSGKTAKRWIDEALEMQIKISLRHSDRQIKQLSDEYGFPNVSFFCKFFKRLTGLSPMEYRAG